METVPALKGHEIVETVEKFEEAYGEKYLQKLTEKTPKERLAMYLINLMIMKGEI